ncbi:MAG: cyclase family protein [Chloroflexi bacterium]|nr:cyclase family protein [Chloroflexota bacterium]MDA1002528.1 cyclase family protein [Chloroflexota bacterium]
MPDLPTEAEMRALFRERNNWGRWGADDDKGAINLITPEKRMQATSLVRTGRTVSLSRFWPKVPGPLNPRPADHFTQWFDRGASGGAVDYYGIMYHGYSTTHIDALCHVWDEHGMWNGRDFHNEFTPAGTKFADITAWQGGIVTRGVLLDVPKHRGTEFVTDDRPVTGPELEAIAGAQGVEVTAGDALIVYSGREKWQAANPTNYMGAPPSPGLHASCSKFIRDHDVALLGWDMMDASPNEYGLAWPVHGVLYSFGVALMDNSLLQPVAEACAEEGRYEFMLMVLPLPVQGGTGSPVNPVAMF